VRVVHGPGTAVIDAPPGAVISLLPLHGTATGVTTSGLRYPLRAEPLLPGSGRGISNEVLTGPSAHVELTAGTLLVIHPLALGGAPCTDA
jgi:thiamine pyrophosphokinase